MLAIVFIIYVLCNVVYWYIVIIYLCVCSEIWVYCSRLQPVYLIISDILNCLWTDFVLNEYSIIIQIIMCITILMVTFLRIMNKLYTYISVDSS